ncbi:cation:proton antiporter [Methylophilaceae bacterium]|jgi:monovalent cation:H+ antiporter-2, CPA2 family|nr:cation:proton antiporter [Methylophilaceae bacterium]
MFESIQLIILLLVSSVLMVALFRYLRLPPMIAYFVVGLILGPYAFGVLPDSESSRHFVEFGIVFLMFTIGLEFSLPKLNSMRYILFGLGGAQVAITLATTMIFATFLGLDLAAAFIIGSALTMSSTAIVSKILMERIDLNSRHGQLSIGILLFQDIAVIFILILIPVFNSQVVDLYSVLWMSLFKIIVLLFILFRIGQPVMNFWFGIVAKQKSRELFVLNVLMITLIFAYVTKLTGLSYALGAFLAGMLISETRYRYQVESDIASFRDILLGLFFISIGMMLNIEVLIQYYPIIFLLFFVYTVFKATVITYLAKLFKYELGVGIRTGVILGQAGEFSFVILALGQEQNLISGDILQIILSVCLLSMLFASFIIPFNGRIARYISKEYLKNSEKLVNKIEASSEDFSGHVIICGYGRGGQYLGRFLKEENISFIAIDMDLNRVNDAANAGEKVMYGDASRRVVLRAAGIERAKALVIAYSDDRSSLKVINVIREIYPDLPIIVRTRDESSIQQLQDAGATDVVPEVLESSLMLASHALVILDIPLARVIKKIRAFRNERYKIFRGYFMGSSEAGDDLQGQDQLQLHSIEIKNNFYLLNKQISEIPFDNFNIEIQHLRRPNMLEDIEARLDIRLQGGDVIVILGLPKDLIEFEKFSITGV